MLDVRKFRARRLLYRVALVIFVVAVTIITVFGVPLRKLGNRRRINTRNLSICEPFLDTALGGSSGLLGRATVSAFAETSVFVNCVAEVAGYSRYLELNAFKNDTFSRVRLGKKEVSKVIPRGRRWDVIVMDGAAREDGDDLEVLRSQIDEALTALTPNGILLISRCSPKSDEGGNVAWRAAVLLRARYDLDVRVCPDWGEGVAVVRKRPTTWPMPLERLPNSAIAALEWAPRDADPPELIFYELFDNPEVRDAVLGSVDFGHLLEWALDLRTPAHKLFGKRVDARVDSARWRRTCASQLEVRDFSAAFSCFKGLLRSHESPQLRNPATLVPQALMLAARGDIPGAAHLLEEARKADPDIASHIMFEAALSAAFN